MFARKFPNTPLPAAGKQLYGHNRQEIAQIPFSVLKSAERKKWFEQRR
jgi:hypothetical protein